MFSRSRPASLASLVAIALVTLAGCGGSQATITPASSLVSPSASAVTTMPAITVVPFTVPTVSTAATPAAAAVDSTATIPAPMFQGTASVKNLAPDIGIGGQEKWFNSAPLTLAGLRGKPVFLVFWSDI